MKLTRSLRQLRVCVPVPICACASLCQFARVRPCAKLRVCVCVCVCVLVWWRGGIVDKFRKIQEALEQLTLPQHQSARVRPCINLYVCACAGWRRGRVPQGWGGLGGREAGGDGQCGRGQGRRPERAWLCGHQELQGCVHMCVLVYQQQLIPQGARACVVAGQGCTLRCWGVDGRYDAQTF